MILCLPVDYTFKTNFEDSTNTVHPDDHKTLVSASNKFILDILKLDVAGYTATSEKQCSVVDSVGGNIYAIHLDYEHLNHEVLTICISYMFKYKNDVPYIHSCNIPIFPIESMSYTPFKDVCPDDVYVFFDKDFNLTAYEINYRYDLQHDPEDFSDFAEMSYIDFNFCIRPQATFLEINYNDYCKEQYPDDFCCIPIRIVDKPDIMKEYLFYFFLFHHNKPSVFETLSYMRTNNLITASGFKHAYLAFNNETNELIEDVTKLIEIECI